MSDSDYLKCSCASCQGHLEFPAHASGITTTCPHCGVETKLVGPAASPESPPPPPPPPPRPVEAVPVTEAPTTILSPVEAPSTGARLKKMLTVVWSVLAGLGLLVFVGLKVWKFFRSTASVVETVKGETKSEKSKPAPAQPAPKSPAPAPAPAPVAPATSVLVVKGNPPARKPGEDLQLLSFEVQKAKDGNLQYLVGVVTNHSAKQFFNVKLEFELTRKDGKPSDLATDTLRNLAANAGVPFKTSIIGTTPVTSAKLAKLEGEKE